MIINFVFHHKLNNLRKVVICKKNAIIKIMRMVLKKLRHNFNNKRSYNNKQINSKLMMKLNYKNKSGHH